MHSIRRFIGNENIARVVGIDPGTTHLGIAIISFDVRTLEIVSTEAFTLNGERLARRSWDTHLHGDKMGRIMALGERLYQFFLNVEPLMVAAESPFMSRRQPSAFMPLVEILTGIRNALVDYDEWQQLYLIDPPTVKMAVGAPGRIGGPVGKENVKRQLLKMPQLRYHGDKPLEQLSEHAHDAIAVAYSRFTTYLKELGLWASVQKLYSV